MFDQVVQWMEMAGTVAEGLLVLRIVGLKLYRIYTFVTLFCVLNLFFDAVSWWAGWKSQETERLVTWSLFLFAALAPFAVWEVFEEVKAQAFKLMRLQAIRLVSGLLMTAICGFVLAAFFDMKDAQGNSLLTDALSVMFWTGSAAACLTFLWLTYGMIRAQKIEPPHNTFVWRTFLLLYLALSILESIFLFMRALIGATASNVVEIAMLAFDLALTCWCILRLKAVPSHVPSAPERPA
jgi:hypothetical protein